MICRVTATSWFTRTASSDGPRKAKENGKEEDAAAAKPPKMYYLTKDTYTTKG